jgi:hypothetical protein
VPTDPKLAIAFFPAGYRESVVKPLYDIPVPNIETFPGVDDLGFTGHAKEEQTSSVLGDPVLPIRTKRKEKSRV